MQQGLQGQRPARRRGSRPVQQNQQTLPMMQQQMLPRGRVSEYPPGCNISEPVPITALAITLANPSPEHQRTMLGESLYPLMDIIEHENAAKVTGMPLEMDQPEVLHLLESLDALKTKVSEAICPLFV
ncbi:polyadenylate-binding protein 2 [Silene latifolia]|uniref:polyadenylate-binding protein 2 n=1 Tax=Silene latifolia TaxID=37657 RepID=UPI003D77CA8F